LEVERAAVPRIWEVARGNLFFVDYLIRTINMMPRIETTLVHGNPGGSFYGSSACGL
jgi:hypothetical protein